MPDQELIEYYTTARTSVREYRTIEIYHPDFANVLRFIQDYENQNLTLENSAPRNAGQSVTFTAIRPLEIKEPNEEINRSPTLSISLGAVGNEVQDQIDSITDNGFLAPIQVIYRKYYLANDGTKKLALTPLYLSASELKFESYNGVAFTARDIDFANRASGEIYTLSRFIGLKDV